MGHSSCSADCLKPLPSTLTGNKYIVVIGDLFTKYVEVFPVATTEASVIAQLFMDHVVFRHGPPRKFLTDRGTNFTSNLVKEMCNLLRIKKVSTSSYHPQTNGFIERVNGILTQTLAMYVSSNQRDWDVHLPAAVFAYNASISATTGDSPFFLTYGREPVLLSDVSMLPPSGLTRSVGVHRQRIITQVQLAREMATEHIQKAQVKMKPYYDQHSRDHPFEVGHKVWIYNPAVKPGLTKKLSCLWHGPYRLMDQVSPVSFKVADVKGKLLKGTVHVSRMKQLYTLQDKPTQQLEVWHNEVLHKDQINEDISTDEEQDVSFNEEQSEQNKIIPQPSGDLQKPLESA